MPNPPGELCLSQPGNVLVVAGAGTGKTRTLVEQCARVLLQEDCGLEEILMATFTEAAAAEMRNRIRARLFELLKTLPDGSAQAEHLQRQLSLLDTACICTLHSFCLRLVRQHFYQLGISPAVLVLDEKQTAPLIAQAFEALFASYYQSDTSEARAVQNLVSSLGRGSEEGLRRLLLKVYHYVQSLEDPEGWVQRQLTLYEQAQPVAWREWLVTGFNAWRQQWLPELQRESATPAIRLFIEALEQGQPFLNKVISALTRILEVDESTANWPRGSKTTIRRQLGPFLKDVKFLHSALVPAFGEADPLQQDWDWVRQDICVLLRLAQEFRAYFTEAKRNLGGVDFSDLEQLALRLLREPAIARQWQERLRFIFVDEFQDINRAQDAILRFLSRAGPQANRFLVGDVKQSIYRFRRADAKIFSQYEAAWREGSSGGQRVPLSHNFRSREALLNFVNAVFSNLMRPAIGGLDYESDVHLQFGNAGERQQLSSKAASIYPNNPASPRVELHLIDEAGEEDEAPDNAEEQSSHSALLDLLSIEREARLSALRLRNLKEQQHLIWDTGLKGFRPVEWRDMVVLLRSPASRVEVFAKEYHRVGIPLAAARSGFFRSREISDLVNLLKLLDNPLQDIPLLAVLRSPLAALSLDELVEIRAQSKQTPFWFALTRFHQQPPPNLTFNFAASAWSKVDFLCRHYEHWRALARQTSLSVCLEHILADTHYEAILLAEARGEERLANVRRLLDLIREYDPWQRQGLYRFLRFLETQEEADVDHEPAPAQSENAVRLMSIHKSKGLEFPVVLLAGLGGRFNTKDLHDQMLLNDTYGLCPKVKPPECVQSYPSLAYWLAKQAERRELLGEELRLLYVAMTRARDTLLLIGSAKNPCWRGQEAVEISDRDLLAGRSYWDWLKQWLPLATKADDWTSQGQGQNELLRWEVYGPADARLEVPEGIALPQVAPSPEQLDRVELLKLQQRILFKYPNTIATSEPAIKRISEIIWTGAETGGEAQLLFPSLPGPGTACPRSQFTRRRQKEAEPSKRSSLTAGQIGDATHRFLENVPLDKVRTLADLTDAAQEMQRMGFLNENEAKALDLKALAHFWDSKIGRRILANPSQQIHRELPFTLRLLPEDLQRLEICPHAGELKGERFVGRGKVDLAVIQPKEIWILDFKTDRAKPAELPEKLAPYARQLKLYALALSQIYQRPVTERWLHFLSLEKTLSVKSGA